MNRILGSVAVSGAAALGTVLGFWEIQHNTEVIGYHKSCHDFLRSILFAHCANPTHLNDTSHSKLGSWSPGLHSTNSYESHLPSPHMKVHRAIDESRKLIQRTMTEQGIPGGQIAVTKNGRLIWSEGFGFADVENYVPCSSQSVMRIASISKPLTTVALLQLWEKGLVDLDAPIQTYVPEFPQKIYNGKEVVITTRQLLSHLAGIRHYQKKNNEGAENKQSEFKNKEYLKMKHYGSVQESLKLFAEDELVSAPGQEYHYTTHGWTLLSAVIEKVSGQSFLDYMQRNVLDPLDMNSTGGEFQKPLVYNRARHYARTNDGKLENVPYVDLSYKWAGGGLISTTEDLVRFGNAVLASYTMSQAALEVPVKQQTVDSLQAVTKTQMQHNIQKSESNLATPHSALSSNENLPLSNQNEGLSSSSTSKSGNLNSHPILEPATTRMMVKKVVDHVSSNGKLPGVGYALGWFVDEGEVSVACGRLKPPYFGHTGGAIGATSVLVVFPEDVNQLGISGDLSVCGACGECACEACNGWSCEPCAPCEARGVVVCVLFNLQEVKEVLKLGTSIAKKFL